MYHNISKLVFLILLCLVPTSIFSQIINVESLRKVTDTTGWHGTTSLNFSLTRNTNDLFRVGNKTHLQYKIPYHLFLLVSDFSLERSAGQNFVNQGSLHFRHNVKLSDLMVWESLIQGQYNSIAKINFRGLLGTGPRFKIIGHEKHRLYVGSILLFEYEEINNAPLLINRDVRGSFYLSISVYPTERISMVSTSYYQPLLRHWSDHRFATENSIVIDLIDKLALKTSYTLTFDSHPAEEVNTTFYNLTTGLIYTFH